ncbi:hypothetical protein [Dulcicalothrix desertica]|nr:hypothetical protein [Dulcicalothrix desertica]
MYVISVPGAVYLYIDVSKRNLKLEYQLNWQASEGSMPMCTTI